MREVDFVIPAYNEADNLKDLTGDIVECFERIGVTNFKILLVENGSDDKSSDLIKKLNTQDERITGIVLSRNFGPQGAIHAGLCHTNAEFVCIMDGDQQDPPKDAANMLVLSKEKNADVVYAVRASRQEKLIRKIGLKASIGCGSAFRC